MKLTYFNRGSKVCFHDNIGPGGGGDSTSSYPGCVGLGFRYVPILGYRLYRN